ncbi:hypothetical protein RRG08_012539 [Elysia crispata]|uniref:ribonuclease H n=1 Tax=Elysia crispata TaxID=231223 RepID=A0AAE1E2B4_9GAST|nr:hypothetical protein RRG08_012539 [Elysia crispata]
MISQCRRNVRSSRLQRKLLNHKVQELEKKGDTASQPPHIEQLCPRVWLPIQRFEVSTKIPGIHSKVDHPPHMLKALTLETLILKYPKCSWIHIYTDGSAEKAVKKGGSGMIAIHPSGAAFSKARPVGVQSTNFKAEMDALLLAAEHLETDAQHQYRAVILSDSLSTLQTLQSNPTDTTTTLSKQLNKLSKKRKIVLQWIPSYSGITGNKSADQLAKEGSKLSRPSSTISYDEAKTLLKNTATQEWQEENEYYTFKNGSIHMLDRKSQTTLFCLRTGHCGLNKHLKKMGMAESVQCQCGATEQTPVHILQTCPHFEEARLQVWPTEAPVSQKLYSLAMTY